MEVGYRLDQDKLRYDLVDPKGHEEMVKVLTFGAQKYSDRNWEKGMDWSRIIGSLKRHIVAVEKGQDYDDESGLLHAGHIACNAHFLATYYHTCPEFDNRPKKKIKRIGLDIDDVLAEWVGTFTQFAGVPIPEAWNFGFPELIKKLLDDGLDYQDVMENLPVKTKPQDIPFEPTCYITNRNHTDVSVAERWLAKNGFPQNKVIQTSDKITAAKGMELDYFVDDKYETFIAMNEAGICTFLFDAPHNRRYDVGHMRIYDLKRFA